MHYYTPIHTHITNIYNHYSHIINIDEHIHNTHYNYTYTYIHTHTHIHITKRGSTYTPTTPSLNIYTNSTHAHHIIYTNTYTLFKQY